MKPLLIVSVAFQALVTGTFFAFSTFVMPALDRLPAGQAVPAMRQINETILSSLFMGTFGFSVLLALALPIANRLWGDGGWSLPLILGAALSFFGVFVVTAAWNVPLNDSLRAAYDAQVARGWTVYYGQGYDALGEAWKAFYAPWMVGNHIRTLASVLAILCTLSVRAR